MKRRDFLKIVTASTFVPAFLYSQEFEYIWPTWGLQAWWSEKELIPGHTSEHLHLDTNFPVGLTVTGEIEFDVSITTHHVPIGSKLLSTKIYSEPLGEIVKRIDWNVIIDKEGDWNFWRHVTLDTNDCGFDGLQEFRFLTHLRRPDKKELTVTSGLQVLVENGNPVEDARKLHYKVARAWYNNYGYQITGLLSELPRTKVIGTWEPLIEINKGSGGRTTDWHEVVVDAANHFHVIGKVIKNKTVGPFKGKIKINASDYSSGAHKLFIIGHEKEVEGTLSSVFVVPFEV